MLSGSLGASASASASCSLRLLDPIWSFCYHHLQNPVPDRKSPGFSLVEGNNLWNCLLRHIVLKCYLQKHRVLTFCFLRFRTSAFFLCEAESSFECRKWVLHLQFLPLCKEDTSSYFTYWDKLFHLPGAWCALISLSKEVSVWIYILSYSGARACKDRVNPQLADLGKRSRLSYLYLWFFFHTQKI